MSDLEAKIKILEIIYRANPLITASMAEKEAEILIQWLVSGYK